MVKWKLEQWVSGKVSTLDSEQLFGPFKGLRPRETAIVGASMIDATLAELLAMRLLEIGDEAVDFLGADDDGRAPAGTFGARIQLALLVGLIDLQMAGRMRAIKAIRNRLAHRVTPSLLDASLQGEIDNIERSNPLEIGPHSDPVLVDSVNAIRLAARSDVEAAHELVRTGIVVTVAWLWWNSKTVPRLTVVPQRPPAIATPAPTANQ